MRSKGEPYTILQSIGGTGVSPVQAQAKACGYHKLLFDCNSAAPYTGVYLSAVPVHHYPLLELNGNPHCPTSEAVMQKTLGETRLLAGGGGG